MGWYGGTGRFEDMMRYYQDTIGYKSHTKNMKDGIRVGSKSFPEFIAKRVLKDNLGYIPGTELYDGITDCKSYIKACIPTEPHEFLVYLHELGHCKSKQYPRESSGMCSFLFCRNTLQNEFNAWKWALRYYRRLGYSLCEKSKKLIKDTYGTYIKNASEIDGAIFAEYMYHLTGVDCSYKKPDIRISFDPSSGFSQSFTVFFDDYELPKTPKVEVQKPKNWKPWHDLKNNQFKKQWRNSK